MVILAVHGVFRGAFKSFVNVFTPFPASLNVSFASRATQLGKGELGEGLARKGSSLGRHENPRGSLPFDSCVQLIP